MAAFPKADLGGRTAYFWTLVPAMFRVLCGLPALLLSIVTAAQGDAPPVRTFEPFRAPVETAVDTPDTVLPPRALRPGRVDVVMDPGVERTMGAYAEHKHEQQGYRVQVFLGDRRTAEDTKRALLLKYPDMPVYLSWLAPNFRLRAGDLRTRVEAEHLLRILRTDHPGSYIVRDQIAAPVLPEEQ